MTSNDGSGNAFVNTLRWNEQCGLLLVVGKYVGGMDLAQKSLLRSLPEFVILAHSHLLVQHLLKQLEHHKSERNTRSHRPEWLSVIIHQVAALFEPLRGVARVGSDCEFTNEGWEARLYLGSTEIVGGKNDGHHQLVSFEIDFSRLSQIFTKLDEFRWSVAGGSDGNNSSFLTLRGYVDEHYVHLKIYSRPPQEAGPAFRQQADGSLDSVTL